MTIAMAIVYQAGMTMTRPNAAIVRPQLNASMRHAAMSDFSMNLFSSSRGSASQVTAMSAPPLIIERTQLKQPWHTYC